MDSEPLIVNIQIGETPIKVPEGEKKTCTKSYTKKDIGEFAKKRNAYTTRCKSCLNKTKKDNRKNATKEEQKKATQQQMEALSKAQKERDYFKLYCDQLIKWMNTNNLPPLAPPDIMEFYEDQYRDLI